METKIQSNKQLNQYLSKGVVNQDSLVGMKNIPDACIDLVLTDPLMVSPARASSPSQVGRLYLLAKPGATTSRTPGQT